MNILHEFFPVTVWWMAGGSGEGAIIFCVQVFLPASWGMVRPRLQTHLGCKWKIV